MRQDARQRKKAMTGLRMMSGEQQMLGVLPRVLHAGKQALDAVMLEMGRMVAERVMRIEREELAGPDYHPTDSALQKWAHEAWSIYLSDQKVKVTRPQLHEVVGGERDAQVLCASADPRAVLRGVVGENPAGRLGAEI